MTTTPQTSKTGYLDGVPVLWYKNPEDTYFWVSFNTAQPVAAGEQDRSWFRVHPDREHYLERHP